jgi:hypothetical protein
MINQEETPAVKRATPRRYATRGLQRGIDRRTARARRYQALLTGYIIQTGGKHREQCQQLAQLVLQREISDAAVLKGEFISTTVLIRLIGTINRLERRLLIGSFAPDTSHAERIAAEDASAGLI